MTIRAELLVLVDSQAACVAVTWPSVERFEEERVGSMEIPGTGLRFSIEEWSGKSGVHGPELVRIFAKLFGNGLIGTDGEVASEVAAYADALIARRIKAGVHRKATALGGKVLDS